MRTTIALGAAAALTAAVLAGTTGASTTQALLDPKDRYPQCVQMPCGDWSTPRTPLPRRFVTR